MPAPFSILAIDLHNTIYDETLEYGAAIEEAVSVFLEASPALDRETVYTELSSAHRQLGSDWDDGAWALLPSLQALSPTPFAQALKRRREKSREMTLATFYAGTRETLGSLKKGGTRIYVVTEAAADAGMRSIEWLELAGVVDGVYSYPSRTAPAVITGTYHKTFPPGAQGHLRKPHPFILAAVALDEAIRAGRVPSGTRVKEVFETKQEPAYLIPELPENAPVQEDTAARLALKETPHAEALQHTLSSMLYVGDSKFRDGMLARNAGVAFGHAAYGKKGQDLPQARRGLETMYAVTGWDKDVMRLTQEAGKSQAVAHLAPDYTFENSLEETLGLFALRTTENP